MVEPAYYRGRYGKEYVAPATTGFCSMPVLTFLNGLPYDNMALNFIHGLRPSCVRVTLGETMSDSRIWRVTVYVHEYRGVLIIDGIEQEVTVGLAGGFLADNFRDGHDLKQRMFTRRSALER